MPTTSTRAGRWVRQKAGAEGAGELGVEHLQGDGAVVAEVLGEVDGGHSAAAELALDAVAIGQGVAQSVRQIAHGASGACGMGESYRK